MSQCWSVLESVPRCTLKMRGWNFLSSVRQLANSVLFGYQMKTLENPHPLKLFNFYLKEIQ